jgi:hypothetical protein
MTKETTVINVSIPRSNKYLKAEIKGEGVCSLTFVDKETLEEGKPWENLTIEQLLALTKTICDLGRIRGGF